MGSNSRIYGTLTWGVLQPSLVGYASQSQVTLQCISSNCPEYLQILSDTHLFKGTFRNLEIKTLRFQTTLPESEAG